MSQRRMRAANLGVASIALLGTLAARPLSPGADSVAIALDDPVFSAPVADNERSKLFHKVSENLRAIKVLRSPFSQSKRIKALRRPLLSSGDFIFAREDGVCWRTKAPFETLFVITPTGLLFKDEGGKKVSVSAKEQPVIHGFPEIFVALFRGDMEALGKSFTLYFSGDEKAWVLGFAARGALKERFIHHVVLRGGATVEEVRVVEASGDRTELKFLRVATEPAVLSDDERRYFQDRQD